MYYPDRSHELPVLRLYTTQIIYWLHVHCIVQYIKYSTFVELFNTGIGVLYTASRGVLLPVHLEETAKIYCVIVAII